MTLDINDLAWTIHQGNVDKGFYDAPPNNATALMLIVSELSEALEADRTGKHADINYFIDRKNEIENSKGKELDNEEYARLFKATIKDTYEDEIADAVIRLLDHCGYRGIDIQTHIAAKLAYNQSRPHKHDKSY
jgi:NTP pyrophosphatase (non-canonical NTP hydrolase)